MGTRTRPGTGLFGAIEPADSRGGTAPEIKIDAEFQALFTPLAPDERRNLEELLQTDGCRDALVTWRGFLLDGHNRYEICTRLGIKFRVTAIDLPDRDAAKAWMIKHQGARRNMSPFSRCEAALRLESEIKAKAKANKIESGKQTGRGNKKVLLESTKPLSPVNTRQELADKADVSTDRMRKAKAILAHASPEVIAKLRADTTSFDREYKAVIRRQRHAERITAVETAIVPDGRYNVIVVDPPWHYAQSRHKDATHRAANPYPSMTTEQIAAVDVASIAMDDAILWLWTPNAFLVQAHQVAEKWGFTVKTMLTWGKDQLGLGDYLRGQTEHALMCVRGKPVVTLTNQSTLLIAKRRQHSRKPDEFYALVESLCPGKKCELFSRQARKGWTCAGAELGAYKPD